MVTTPGQLVAVEEVQSSTIGDQVPNPAAGSLTLFSNQNGNFYTKNSSGVVSGLATTSLPFTSITGQATLAQLPTMTNNTVLGNVSGGSATPTDLSASQLSTLLSLGALATENQVTLAQLPSIGADTILGNATGGTATPTALSQTQATALINLATAGLSGAMSGAQFTKLAETIGQSSGWYDVAANGLVPNNTGVAGANITAINALLAAATPGSVIWFGPGVWYFNAAWNSGSALPAAFMFMGAYGQSSIAMTANVGGTWITADATANDPTSFFCLCFFSSGVNQTAGAGIEFGNSAQPVVMLCQWNGGGGSNHTFNGISMTGSNSGNGGVVEGCNFGQCAGTPMIFSGGQGSTAVVNCLINGNLAGGGNSVSGINCTTPSGVSGGSVLINNCDVIGCTNNLLLNPVVSTTLASVFAIHSFFDQSVGAGLLCTGAGTIVRCRFVACWFTLASGSSSQSAIQTMTSGSSIHEGIEFDSCWVLNTPAGGGTANGFNIAALGNFTVNNCQISGWNGSGMTITPAAGSVTIPILQGNNFGASGGLSASTTGLTLQAGTYGGQLILGNNFLGCTTTISDSTTVTTTANNNRTIKYNLGFNPKSVVAQPAVPATTVAVWNSTGVDCVVYVHEATAVGDLTVITIGGVAVTTEVAATASVFPVFVAANQSIALTFTSTAPTWTWVGT